MKEHKKLYKSGKLWVTATLFATTLGLAIGFSNTAEAATGEQPAVTVQTTTANTSSNVQATASQAPTANATAQTSQATAATSQTLAAGQSYDANDHGNYAYLDSYNVTATGQLHVVGWHATNNAQTQNNHWIIALDQSTGHEINRQKVAAPVSRPDVQQVHNVYGAAQSGFSVNLQLPSSLLASGHPITIISRYTSSVDANSNYTDYWFKPLTLDQGNYAYLDNISVKDNQLHVAGWHVTNQAAGKGHHFIIIYDRSQNREIARHEVTSSQRNDVARVYPTVANASQSGFSTNFSLHGVNFSHQLQVISRYSNAVNGEGQYVDYWFSPVGGNYTNQAYLDSFNLANGKQLTISGWHANDISQFEGHHFLILFDTTANKQVGVVNATAHQRPDVQRACPGVQTAKNSGFSGSFDLTKLNLQPGHAYAVVSRYSTSAAGNGGQGQYTDYWFAPVSLNQKANWFDSIKMTKEGLHLTGWVADDNSLTRPYAYAIVLSNGKEVGRAALNLTTRNDVANQFPAVYNSQKSGFQTTVKVDPNALGDQMQIILRFASDRAGNVNYSDQTSQQYSINQGYYDQINVGTNSMTVSGWHVSDAAVNKPHQYLIFLDVGTGKELYRVPVTDTSSRPDVAKVYPAIYCGPAAGFKLSFTIPAALQRHVVRIIHRYTDDANGNGHFTDWYSGPVSVNAITYNMYANRINAYIMNHHIGHAQITLNHVIPEDLTGTYSRTSNGKPDIVVVHETANANDSIWGEINYEKTHYEDAFVHAFVDGNNIIEISTTDHEAWGAKYPANGRAIQFEQVEVYGADNFARELVNGAYYAAYKMREYGIIPSLYQSDGSGTLWSHHNVTEFTHDYGGHVDPDGYWARRAALFGSSYTMRDFFELVKYEYMNM